MQMSQYKTSGVLEEATKKQKTQPLQESNENDNSFD